MIKPRALILRLLRRLDVGARFRAFAATNAATGVGKGLRCVVTIADDGILRGH